MRNFISSVFGTIIGIIISFIIFFLFLIIIIAASSGGKTVEVRPNSILHLVLDKEIIDRASRNPFKNFNLQKMETENKMGLNEILENINKAKTDNNITGIYLDAAFINTGGFGIIDEIRNALTDFKASGKFIISYSDFYSQRGYYLASVADKMYLTPKGLIDFEGLRAEILFFKKALDKLGIDPQIIRGKDNKYKSAVEPLISDRMSEESREQTKKYVESIWNYIVEVIAEQRNSSVEELNKFADQLISFDPEAALENKMVDGLKYKDEIFAELKELSGIEGNNLRFVSLEDYINVSGKRKGFKKEKIAVIYASGPIYLGKGDEKTIGSETLSEAIRQARRDSMIKAIVLRVNSGGGSLLASEIIWREVDLAKKTKPVIASLSNVAASGGYYITAPSDVIVASPNTITGSIGIFGVIWNVQKFLNNKLNITSDGVSTNANSGFGYPFRPMTTMQKSVIQKSLDKGYDTFVSHVAEGRNMTVEQVKAIGGGRVWSAKDAIEIGLIDEFGGLERAIELAAEKAEIENFKIISLPAQPDPIEQFIMDLMANTKSSIIKKELKENYKYYEQLKNLQKIDGIQARMPYEIELY